MSQIDFERVIGLLKDFTQEKKAPLELILIGGLALHFYGKKDRVTADVDAEVKGDLEALFLFLKEHHIPSDLSEDFSGWSVIAMPPGYQGRAQTVYEDPLLKIKILSPLDFIVAKLRRFTEEDIEDALFVAGKNKVSPQEVEQAAETAIEHSAKDTTLFLFRKNVLRFSQVLKESRSGP